MKVSFKLLDASAHLPTRAHSTDAGFDLYSTEDVSIDPGKKEIVSLGIASVIPEGHFVSIRDRSGLAAKHGLHVLAGVIDSAYRGEWKVVLVNLGEEEYEIEKGERIAQGVLHKLPKFEIEKVSDLDETDRGSGGFGSSGRK